MMSNGAYISATDLYNLDAPVKEPAPDTATRTSEAGQVKSAPAFSWLMLVILFVAFGILYEMSELAE